jgi:tetratricopeptide (TPR) repeat protein
MLRHVLFRIVVLALCGTFAKEVSADKHDDDAASAKVYFEKGEELFEDGAYLEAAAAFQRAYEITPHPAVLTNIGYCYEYAKAYVKAVTIYSEYLETSFEKDPATVEDIRNRLAQLMLMVGELHVKCHPGECAVEVDGVRKGNTKDGTLVVIMAPGKYSVTARQDDEQSESTKYRIEAGEKTYARFSFENSEEVEASPPQESIEPPPPPSDDTLKSKPNRAPRLKIAFFALSGGALAGGVMVAVFGALTLKVRNDYEDSAYRDPEAHDAAKRNKLITNISIGVASALAVGAVTVKLLEVRANKREENLEISLAIDANNLLGLQGRF